MKSNVDDATWYALFNREEGTCQCCGSDSELSPAHYISQARGGPDTLDNLMLLCWNCHRAAHDGKLLIKRINDHYFFKWRNTCHQ
jgi:5-methylcytosine-specific restriction endonuclease McrA